MQKGLHGELVVARGRLDDVADLSQRGGDLLAHGRPFQEAGELLPAELEVFLLVEVQFEGAFDLHQPGFLGFTRYPA